jgi:uncharacterized protein YdaU (DUF1376 family)
LSSITHVRFYPSDWLAGTRGMTAAEMGVYITLIAMMYERAGPVDGKDNAKLARLCGTSASALRGILDRLISDGKITETDGFLFNRRAELEIKNVLSKSGVAREKATARWEKTPTKSTQAACNGIAPAMLASSQYPVIETTEEKPSVVSAGKPAARTAKADGKGRGSRLAPDWQPSPDDRKAALAEGMPEVQVDREANKFRDYWTGRAGANGVKLDWSATWRNWVRRACEDRGWTPDAQPMARAGPPQPPAPNLPTDAELRAKWAAALAIPEPTDEERWIPN